MEKMPKFVPEEERLEDGEAHEEANMMRAKLKISPKTGQIETSKWDGNTQTLSFERREATAEDYNNALIAIEEIKKIAAEEPTFERIINKFCDITLKANVGSGINLALQEIYSVYIESFPRPRTDEFKEAWKQHRENTKIDQESELFDRLNSAENKLKELRKKAESYK